MARTSAFDEKKHDVLASVGRAALAHSRTPTVRELAHTFEVAPATMHAWLNKLSEEGLITWEVGRHRSLNLTQQGRRMLNGGLTAPPSLPTPPVFPATSPPPSPPGSPRFSSRDTRST